MATPHRVRARQQPAGAMAGGIDPYRVLFVVGALVLVLTLFMIPPMLADLVADNDDWEVFAGSALLSGFVGLMLVLVSRDAWSERVRLKEGFVLTVVSWLVLSLVAAVPYLFLEQPLSFADAWFEAVSGLTTTGSTIFANLDTMPEGVLLWRSLTQWIGGIGIVVMAMIMLPFLKVGGMQLFQTESSDRSDKIVPHARQFITYLAAVYVALTIACMIAYKLAGMRMFDALNHAMTTVATGGFSTRDASFGHFDSILLHWVAICFMIAGALPLVLYVRMMREKRVSLFADRQARAFLRLLALTVLLLVAWRVLVHDAPPAEALTTVTFNVVSIVSTTGYSSGDYTLWGALSVAAFLVLMFFGGCTGSTAGGMKIFRLQVMMMAVGAYLKRLSSPHRVVTMTYENRTVTADIAMAVFAYLSVMLVSVAILAVLLAFTGVDFLTALSGAITAITNVGPGLGPVIGPSGTFAPLPDTAKMLLSFGMLLGRLEFFTLLVVLQPGFWK